MDQLSGAFLSHSALAIENQMEMQAKKRFKSGNVAKAENYAAAWRQIKKATESKFFIEALSIQESIISDRLLHHLHQYYNLPLRNRRNWHHKLNDLINEARSANADDRSARLFRRVNRWRNKRNNAVHALVRSDPGAKEISSDIFFVRARRAALVGKRIAREVDNWCRRDARRLVRLGAALRQPLIGIQVIPIAEALAGHHHT